MKKTIYIFILFFIGFGLHGFAQTNVSTKDITLPTDKAFRWYNYKDLPASFITALTDIPGYKSIPLINHVRDLVEKDSCEVKIAAIDLDNDGVYGFIIYETGSYCCGSQGCTYEIYENGGAKFIFLTDYQCFPAMGGVRSSNNHLIKPVDNNQMSSVQKMKMTKDFVYAHKPFHAPLSGPGSGGGLSPDALGRLLLTALKTNNEALWMSCTNPESTVVDQSFSRQRFKEYRQWMEQDGVSDWAKVRFNRVTFNRNNGISSDNGVSNGDQVRRDFVVEFDYGEFVGAFGNMTISTAHGGTKYLIWWPGKDTRLIRRPRPGE